MLDLIDKTPEPKRVTLISKEMASFSIEGNKKRTSRVMLRGSVVEKCPTGRGSVVEKFPIGQRRSGVITSKTGIASTLPSGTAQQTETARAVAVYKNSLGCFNHSFRGSKSSGGSRSSIGSKSGSVQVPQILQCPWTARVQKKSYMAERRRRVMFGETEYLRDKLGFCMPPVKQTLSTGGARQAKLGAPLGFKQLSKLRVLTIQSLLLESASQRSQDQGSIQDNRSKTGMVKNAPSIKTGSSKKGATESKQYVLLLDANTRRAKHLDDVAKFALSQEMMRQEAKKLALDGSHIKDQEVLARTKNTLEAAKANESEKKKKRERHARRVRIKSPKNSCDSSVSSEDVFTPDSQLTHSRSQNPADTGSGQNQASTQDQARFH